MTVTARDEIELNGYKYRIKGGISGAWIDPFPEQFTLGDADYANRRDLSSWIINDLRGGIGVEEMDEKKDWNKCWWTNCIIKYRGHFLPPRLASTATLPSALTVANADMEADSDWTGGARSATQKHGGSYSWHVTAGNEAYQDLTWTTQYQGRKFTADVYMYQASSNNGKIKIDDGVDSTESSHSTTAGSWHKISVTHTFNAAATRFRLIILAAAGGSGAYFDDVDNPTFTTGTANHFCEFNGKSYVALGNILAVRSSGTTFNFVHDFNTEIKALIASLNNRLYIYLGDSTNYYWMDTSESLTQSNTANANWGFQHDAKLFKVNTSGTVKYSTNPDNASPTWTSAGSITDIASQIEGFVIGRDADGNYVPYAATHSILKAYDSSTPQWIDTEAVLPNHPIGGQGHAYWNGKIYLSYGLAVKEYYPETGAFLDIGLTERDGLPVEYNGEIVKLLGDSGVKGMFAAVDASVTSGNSKSGVYLYDGVGWQCWWADTTNNQVMGDIIVSGVDGYAVYWGVGTSVYKIDIPRGIQNPDKISQSYATAGILLTPWFDAGNPVASKLAKVLEDWAKGITTTETVALKYRIDHTNTDLDTGWTTLDTLNTAGETGHNEELFASGAGLSFKAIQFRLDFVTPGSTAKPDIQSLALYFKKRTGSEKLRTWRPIVICNNEFGTSAKEKVANLKAAIESTTDVVFSYHPNDDSTESYYVTVNCPRFSEQTGREYEANYELQVIES